MSGLISDSLTGVQTLSSRPQGRGGAMLTSDMVAVPNPDDGPGLAKVIATLDFTQLGAKGWNPRTQGARKANWVECMDEAVNAAGISLAVVLSDPPSLMQIVSARLPTYVHLAMQTKRSGCITQLWLHIRLKTRASFM